MLLPENLTFHQYSTLSHPTSDVLEALGYEYSVTDLDLPRTSAEHELDALKQQMIDLLPYVNIADEMGRREFYVTPFWQTLMRYTPFRLDIEYNVDVGAQLRGVIDYMMRGKNNVVVIEAKRGDMERGFTQLAAEMIAVSKHLDIPLLYGAVTIGNLWQFGQLTDKLISKDITTYALPQELDPLFSIFSGLLSA